MKILLVHNRYRLPGGEEVMVERTRQCLEDEGHTVMEFFRDSGTINSTAGKLRSIFSAVHAPGAINDFRATLREFQPDLVHVHNLLPLISPVVLREAKAAGCAVVMTCHNYRLGCPIATHIHRGSACHRCLNGREYQCFINNCRDNGMESLAYAMRSMAIRWQGHYHNHIDHYIAISHWIKHYLTESVGLRGDSVSVVHNVSEVNADPDWQTTGDSIVFAGRLSEEKGIEVVLELARNLPHIPFKVAGDGPMMAQLSQEVPDNMVLLGQLEQREVLPLFHDARIVLVPSLNDEPFGLVAIEAMGQGTPVLLSNTGAFPELIQEGEHGYLVNPHSQKELMEQVQDLWNDPERCVQLGKRAHAHALKNFNAGRYYDELMGAYENALRTTREQ